MFSGVSNITNTVDAIFLLFLVISIVLFALIVFAMIFFVIRYGQKRHAEASQIEGSLKLEVVWTVVPVILVLGMFYFGWQGSRIFNDIPDDAMQIKVVGSMWQWNFEYPNGKMHSELNVPVDRPIKLHLTALDVLHSFYVPAFRLKEDTVPGMDKYTWFEAKEVGAYDILCAEYCGLEHAYMLSKVVVMSQPEFDTWYATDVPAPAPEDATDETNTDSPPADPESEEAHTAAQPSRGMQLMMDKGCILCHTTEEAAVERAEPALATTGPTFQGIFGKSVEVVTDGQIRQLIVDETYLRRSILEPSVDIVQGFHPVMPTRPITDEELTDLIDYLREL